MWSSGDRKGSLNYKGRGLFSLNLLHFSVSPSPTPFHLGKRTQNHVLTSPNLPPCCLLPWSIIWFPSTHTPSSSSTQDHGWGSPCRTASPGSWAARTQSFPLPFSSLPTDSGPSSHLRHGLLSTPTSSFPSASSILPVLHGLHAQHQGEPTAHHFLVSQPLWHQEKDASSVLLMGLK